VSYTITLTVVTQSKIKPPVTPSPGRRGPISRGGWGVEEEGREGEVEHAKLDDCSYNLFTLGKF